MHRLRVRSRGEQMEWDTLLRGALPEPTRACFYLFHARPRHHLRPLRPTAWASSSVPSSVAFCCAAVAPASRVRCQREAGPEQRRDHSTGSSTNTTRQRQRSAGDAIGSARAGCRSKRSDLGGAANPEREELRERAGKFNISAEAIEGPRDSDDPKLSLIDLIFNSLQVT